MVEFRIAVPDDGPAILRINEHWNVAYERRDLGAGFLRARFDLDQVLRIVENGDSVVATDAASVIGYYLTNTVIKSASFRQREALVSRLVSCGKLPVATYAMQTQAGVLPDYHRQGIARRLLQSLREQVRDRFHYLIGVIYSGNEAAMIAHTRSGWRCVEPVAEGWLAATPTGREVAR